MDPGGAVPPQIQNNFCLFEVPMMLPTLSLNNAFLFYLISDRFSNHAQA